MLLQPKLNVVVTGGSRGFGKSLTRAFAADGHNVLFTSRHTQGIHGILSEVADTRTQPKGIIADLTKPADVEALLQEADLLMPQGIDVWINNAAISDGNRGFLDTSNDRIRNVVQTNLTGTILCTQAVVTHMLKHRSRMGHVFNVVGAGADGSPTPDYAVYGSTKAGVAQFTRTLQRELEQGSKNVGMHIVSPGMMATDMLQENICDAKKQIFNILCEHPDAVAREMLPQIKQIVKHKQKAQQLRFLTIPRIIYRFASAASRKNRFW